MKPIIQNNKSTLAVKSLIALFYAVLVLVFFYPVLQGMLISQTGYLNFISPWDSVRADDFSAIPNPFLQDQTNAFLPFFLEAKSQISSGLFPLWNPYILAGTPLWANTQSALMFPLNFFHYLFEAPIGFTLSSLFKVFFGCVFMHLYIRKLGMSHGPALLAGTAFGFCSFTVFWLNHPHTNVTPLIPLCFYMVERLVQKPDSRNIMLYALVAALTLIAGHVEIAFLTSVGCGLYYLCRLIQRDQLSLSGLWKFLAVYIYALLLSAVLIIPFIEFLFNTAIWSERANVEFSIPTSGLINLFMGDFFRFDGWNDRNIGYHAFSPYVGMFLIPLVLFAIISRIQKIWPIMLVGIFSLAIAFTIDPVHWLISKLPLFNHLPLFYFNVILAFVISVLAAVGLEQSLKKDNRSFDLITLVVVLVLVWLYLYFIWQPGGLAEHVQDVSLLSAHVTKSLPWLLLVFAISWLLIYLAPRLKKLAVLLFIILVFADLWNIGHDWNPVIHPEIAMPIKTPEVINFLHKQKEPFRTVGHNRIMQPSTNMLAQIHEVRGYDVPVIDRYHKFFNQALAGEDRFWYYDLPIFKASILPFLNILNVRYVLSKAEIPEAEQLGLKLAHDIDVNVYENQNAKGLVYFVDQVKMVESKAKAMEEVLSNPIKLQNWAVIEGPNQASSDSDLKEGEQSISYGEVNSQSISVKVETTKNTWLVLSQTYYPGWKAYIEGEETEIFPANYVLQAIKIPSGTHQVTFKYQPLSFTLGWLVSLLSLIFALWKIRKTK